MKVFQWTASTFLASANKNPSRHSREICVRTTEGVGIRETWCLICQETVKYTNETTEEPFAWMNAFKLVNHRANGRFPRVTVAGIGWTLLTGISTSTGPFWARPIKTQDPKAKVVGRISRVDWPIKRGVFALWRYVDRLYATFHRTCQKGGHVEGLGA